MENNTQNNNGISPRKKKKTVKTESGLRVIK
jgi:hypothetical protein